MSIHFAVLALTYVVLLVITYAVTTFLNKGEEQSEEILRKAFNNALAVFVLGLMIVYALLVMPHIMVDHHLASYLIIGSKFVSVATLGISIFLLSRRDPDRMRQP